MLTPFAGMVTKPSKSLDDRLGKFVTNLTLSQRLGPKAYAAKRKAFTVTKDSSKNRISKKISSSAMSSYKKHHRTADCLVLDSGANVHLVDNKSTLTNYFTLLSNIGTADSATSMKSIGKGDLIINSKITLEDVYHCPNAAMSLLSVYQLTKLGLTVTFDNAKCTVTRNNEVVLLGIQENGLYVYRLTSHSIAYLAINQKTTRMDLFHARMGHINYADLRRLVHMSDGIVLDRQPETEICKSCIMAKSHRKHFAASSSHAKRFGELTHIDICYVGIESFNGRFTQFLLFIDDATRYIKPI
jgi:hypothetical protein